MSATADAVSPSIAPVAFTGRNGDFRRLVTRGALLELVTFGFYRFWLTTDIRRHLWSRTEVDGDAFEYIGRGKELLFGFLVATAVLGPFFLGYFLLGLEFERLKAFASLPLYLLVLAFGQFAAYRARRYRLTRTIWRGVRFWMTGSGWSYAWRSLLWGLLLPLTLGFAYPWRTAALERYKLGHTMYGNLPGRFEATGAQLFRRVWWIWLLGITPFLMVAGSAVVLIVFAARHVGQKPPAAAGAVMGLSMLLFIALPFLHAVRRAREWAWWAGGIRFGRVQVVSYLRPSSLIGVYWAVIGWFALVAVAYGAIVGSLAVALLGRGPVMAARSGGHLPLWAYPLYAVMYLLLLVALGIVARIYTLQRVWRRVADSCAVLNLDDAANVTSVGDIVSAFGEGLADGLDFGL